MDLLIETKDKNRRSEELNPILLILGISSIIFFGVFLICSYFNNTGGGKTLKSVKNPRNSISPSLPKIEMPLGSINIVPVQTRPRH